MRQEPTSPPYLVEIVEETSNGTLVNFLSEVNPTPTVNPKPEVQKADIKNISVPTGKTVEEQQSDLNLLRPGTTKTPGFFGGISKDKVYDFYPENSVWPDRTIKQVSETGEVSEIPYTTNAALPTYETKVPSFVNDLWNSSNPYDPRLIFAVNENDRLILSFSTADQYPLISGILGQSPSDPNQTTYPKYLTSMSTDEFRASKNSLQNLYGVPSLMNVNSYSKFSGGKDAIPGILDRENQPRFYDITVDGTDARKNPENKSFQGELTVPDLIKWSEDAQNRQFPYRYQDFVFLKYWKKIPLNRMITLRRYFVPVNDSVTSFQDSSKKDGDKGKGLDYPAAWAVTFLNESNTIGNILGNMTLKMNWDTISADVWDVQKQGNGLSPKEGLWGSGYAKLLGMAAGDDTRDLLGPPPDPYADGPLANRVKGPINVIYKTMTRKRGLEFDHKISLVFEYSARSIGGINTKAAMLDILSNIMVLTYNEAPFWGGDHRFMPQDVANKKYFWGGEKGREAWVKGEPDKFFKAVSDQFTKAFQNIGEMFSKIFQDPVQGLKDMAMGTASAFMLLNTTGGRGYLSGLRAILSGEAVGEWHLTVGDPRNPMMMIGNLVCTGCKIDFGEEIGPDDFPTELKVTIDLEHGMPRDRVGIESMFNRGNGRIYSLPRGFADKFSSSHNSKIDSGDNMVGLYMSEYDDKKLVTLKTIVNGNGQALDNIFNTAKNETLPAVKNTLNTTFMHGKVTSSKVDTNTSGIKNNQAPKK